MARGEAKVNRALVGAWRVTPPGGGARYALVVDHGGRFVGTVHDGGVVVAQFGADTHWGAVVEARRLLGER